MQSAGERVRKGVILTAFLGCALAMAAPARASEGGVSFYLLGSGGPGAALLPPLEGVFIDNTSYYYDGSAGSSAEFLLGGNIAAGLDATAFINMTTVLWVPSTNVLGGTLAVGATLPIGGPSIDAEAILTGPRGRPIGISVEDSTFTIGDPVLMAALSWKAGKNVTVSTSSMVNIPVGHYREGRLANLSFHRWAVDLSTAITWHDPAKGWDISAKTGVTFNGKNDTTDYDTGTEWHVEGSVERIFSPVFSAGLVAYHFSQLSGDSGDGATLGSFKGRVSAIGATAAVNFKVGPMPVNARLRVFEEFGAKNRMDGTVALFSLGFPLHVKMPPGPPPPPQ